MRPTAAAGCLVGLGAALGIVLGAGFAGGMQVIGGTPAVMAGVRLAPSATVPRDWPAAKAARMRAEDRLRRAAASRPLLPPPPGRVRQPPGRVRQQAARVGAQAALTSGIVPLAGGGPFGPSRFVGTNLWNGRVGASWEVIQAGGIPYDRALGAASPARAGLFVYTRSPDPASAAAPRIMGIRVPSPDPRGRFTVRKISGHVLSLSLSPPSVRSRSVPSPFGSPKSYYFNVVTLRFTR